MRRTAGPLTDENTPMRVDGTQHLIAAILARAVRDLGNTNSDIRAEARLWLMDAPLCAEICEVLGYSLPALHRAVGLHDPEAKARTTMPHEVE